MSSDLIESIKLLSELIAKNYAYPFDGSGSQTLGFGEDRQVMSVEVGIRRQGIAMSYGCQQIMLHCDKDTQAIIEYLCRESNKVWNCSVYYARQVYFQTRKIIKRAEICAEMTRSKNKHFGAMYVSSAQQTCNNVGEAFKSFQELTKLWKRGEVQDKPSLPKYRKAGLFTVTYPKRWLKLLNPPTFCLNERSEI